MAVNLSFIGGAGWQFFDNNGKPLSGGKLYTYAAGTSTPQPTFTSRTGLTANTNPIILDSAGRTPEQIWSTEGLLYKYVVETANNVLIRSWDNIGGSVVASDLAQDLAAPSGSSLVGFLQAGAGAVATTVQTKLRETISVKDFGAVGDGVTDDTQAFIDAGAGALVPDGEYLIDETQIDVWKYQGSGLIKTISGQEIKLIDSLENAYFSQKKFMEPFFGFNNGVTDTQIYPNARNALQGIAYLNVSGVDKLFVTQRPVGATWADTERIRIVEFNLGETGAVVNNIAYSPELNLGHGFDLSAQIEGSDIVLYTSEVTALGSGGEAAGKGYSRVVWKGAATTQSDVTSYKLWGAAGSGQAYESFNRAGVAVSTDGRLLIMVNTPSNVPDRTVFVYDKAEVEALVNKLDATPIAKWNIPIVPSESAFSIQGICSDGKHVYVLRGGTPTFGQHQLLVFLVNGTFLRSISVDDAREQYGLDGLLDNATLGNPSRFEPQGLTLRGDQILVSCQESWKETAKIVTFQGENWAAVELANDDTTGVPPSNGSYWVRTTKAATDGAWSESVNYSVSANFSLEKKTVYAISPEALDATWATTDAGITDTRTRAEVDMGEGEINASFRWRNMFSINGYSERLRKFFNALAYDTSSRLRIYDQRVESDNTQHSTVQANFTSTLKALVLRARGTTANQGALLRLHSSDDPTYPHQIIESARTDGLFTRITDSNGTTQLIAKADNAPLVLSQPNDGIVFGFEKTAGSLLFGFYQGSGSPEGAVTAPVGSLYINASGGANTTLYVKETGSGNTGWAAK